MVTVLAAEAPSTFGGVKALFGGKTPCCKNLVLVVLNRGDLSKDQDVPGSAIEEVHRFKNPKEYTRIVGSRSKLTLLKIDNPLL